MSDYVFTSESVAAGHPDKTADRISDAVLDALLRETARQGKPLADVRCACETLIKTGMVVLAGEMRAAVSIDVEGVTRTALQEIGYDHAQWGFSAQECAVLNALGAQSADIAQGVDKRRKKKIGAGDQGLMFGYACSETKELMPLPIQLSHRLMQRHAQVRRRQLPWLGPDAKAQISVRYQNGKPLCVEGVVLSTQHTEKIDGRRVGDNDKRIRRAVLEHIIAPVLKKQLPRADKIFINPTGRFVIGGPKGDAGVTGRKIIVDTYGGAAPHGGGAFSGKDPTKVDRSAAYMMRYVAKNIVAAGLAKKCLVQAAYAIGVADAVSVMIDTAGTGVLPDKELHRRVRRVFDFTPEGILRTLDLWRPIYEQTSAYGHFGRNEAAFSWEKTDKVAALLG